MDKVLKEEEDSFLAKAALRAKVLKEKEDSSLRRSRRTQ